MRRALIVGAGIAGLSAAIALRRADWDVEIIDRASGPSDVGAGIYVPGNGTRALARLGVADAMARHAAVIERQRFLDHRGRLLVEVDLPSFWGSCGPCLGIARGELSRILREATNNDIRYAVTATGLDAHDGTVTLSDSATRRVDLIVGADGVHSDVRALIGDRTQPRLVGQHCWRFIVEDLDEVRTWTVLLGRRRTFLMVPLGDGKVYCYADVSAEGQPRHRADQADHQRIHETFADFAAPVTRALARLDRHTSVHAAAIEEVLALNTVHGRVALVGDAAHATSPNMAQGAATAGEDALVLAEELSANRSVPDALTAFAARRRSRTDWVREQTHRRDRTRALPGPIRAVLLRLGGDRIYRSNYQPLLAPP